MRNLQISYFRVTAMLMVVCYRCLCYYGIWPDSTVIRPEYVGLCRFLNSIDMPVFFMLSAYLYTDKSLNTKAYNDSWVFVKKKVKRLLFPYLLWGVAINLLFIHRYHFTSLLTGISHLWFLLALMMIFLITHLTRRFWIKLSNIKLCLLTVLLLLISIIRVRVPINILAIGQTLQYLPFFFVGIILAINKSRSPLSSHHRICYILIFSLSCSFLLCFYNSQFHLLDIFIKYIILPLFSILIISTSWLLCKHIRFKEYSVINSLDRNSMGIYIIHHVLLIAAISNDSIAYVIKAHYIAAPVAMFFIALSTSWLISSFLNRLKISSYIFG